MSMILIIGETGNAGLPIVSQMLCTGAAVRALTRNPDSAGLPPATFGGTVWLT